MKLLSGIFTIFLLAYIPYHSFAQVPLKPRDTTIKSPQTFALLVGISKYKYIRPLQYADKDAELVKEFLKSPAGGRLSDDNIFMLLNENADNANFWSKGFQWLKAKKLQKGDRLFIYMAGHGDAIDEDQFFFLGYDCNPGGDKNNYLVGGAIQLFNLKKKIANETAKGVEVFFIMDACRSNELPGGTTGQNFLNSAISEKKAGEIIMLATGAGQESLEDASIGNGHGLFTYYLIDGLRGLADSINIKDYKVTLNEIKSYVDQNVSEVARKRFNKTQSPYFCCDDKSGNVISNVDSLYLINFLKIKMEIRKGGGNSYTGFKAAFNSIPKIDSTLSELYNRFNNAIRLNSEAGRNEATRIFDMLENKFPGTPHTLDAKSTLAASNIRFAQQIMSGYITNGVISPEQKKDYQEAALRLEKATLLLSTDEPEFIESLKSRLFFLKTVVEPANRIDAFKNAYTSLAMDKNAAFINNRLATMHLENKNADSAIYYVRRAMAFAPKWRASYSTLSEVYKTISLPDSAKKYEQQSKAIDPSKQIEVNIPSDRYMKTKPKFGFLIGAGINRLNPTYSGRQTSNIVGVNPVNAIKFDLGIFFFTPLNQHISIRPTFNMGYENSDIEFERRNATGGQITTEKIHNNIITGNLSVPLLLNFSDKNIAPYLLLGPSFSYIIGEDKSVAKILPVSKSIFSAEAGLGLNIKIKKSGFIISPEFKYSAGLNNIKKESSSEYSTAVSTLKKQGFSISFYFRKK